MDLSVPISLLIIHFIGDFLLQSDWMALNKSKSWLALSAHCYVYSLLVGGFMGSYWLGVNPFTAIGITFVAHFITDAITSRITSKLWFMKLGPACTAGDEMVWRPIERKRHWFFVMIGFDQFIHYVTLAWTLKILSAG